MFRSAFEKHRTKWETLPFAHQRLVINLTIIGVATGILSGLWLFASDEAEFGAMLATTMLVVLSIGLPLYFTARIWWRQGPDFDFQFGWLGFGVLTFTRLLTVLFYCVFYRIAYNGFIDLYHWQSLAIRRRDRAAWDALLNVGLVSVIIALMVLSVVIVRSVIIYAIERIQNRDSWSPTRPVVTYARARG
jgi:hypothetical protein